MAVPSLLSARAPEPHSVVPRSTLPASLAGSAFFPGAALVEGGKRRPPERMRRLHDLHVMKSFEAQVPFMGVPRGFVEPLQFGIDLGH